MEKQRVGEYMNVSQLSIARKLKLIVDRINFLSPETERIILVDYLEAGQHVREKIVFRKGEAPYRLDALNSEKAGKLVTACKKALLDAGGGVVCFCLDYKTDHLYSIGLVTHNGNVLQNVDASIVESLNEYKEIVDFFSTKQHINGPFMLKIPMPTQSQN